MNWKRWRPLKTKPVEKLTKLEKENIYYEYENGWREIRLSEFAAQMRLTPIDMAQFLRKYEVATGEDVGNELKRILKGDSEIVKKSQEFIVEYLDNLSKSRNKITEKNIETILKAADSSLKRTTIINKIIEDKANVDKSNNVPMIIKLQL